MPPPPSPVGGVQVEPTFSEKEKGKGKMVVKGKVQGGGNDEDDERNDQAVDDPSYKDNHDLSARCIVQQVRKHSIPSRDP